jgi:hypothetical protein
LFHSLIFFTSPVSVKVLEQMLAGVVGDHLDGVLFTYALAVEAVLAILNVAEDRLFGLRVPADHVHEAGFVALLAAHALFRRELDAVFGMDHAFPTFFKNSFLKLILSDGGAKIK